MVCSWITPVILTIYSELESQLCARVFVLSSHVWLYRIVVDFLTRCDLGIKIPRNILGGLNSAVQQTVC